MLAADFIFWDSVASDERALWDPAVHGDWFANVDRIILKIKVDIDSNVIKLT
jgi:hypothetical protein